jgi:aminoglycoside phosphotransferase (APT) family kinase protein
MVYLSPPGRKSASKIGGQSGAPIPSALDMLAIASPLQGASMSIQGLSGLSATDQIQTGTAGGTLADGVHGAAQSRAVLHGEALPATDDHAFEGSVCPLGTVERPYGQTWSDASLQQDCQTGPMSKSHVTSVRARSESLVGVIEAMADAKRGCEVLRQMIPELRSGAWRLLSYEVTGVRKKRGGYIVKCRIYYRNGTGPQITTAAIVAKADKRTDGARALEILQQLWEAGFRPPARHRVPRPYGYWPEQRTLFQALAPGAPWADFFHRSPRALCVASARAAEWLLQLQRVSLRAELKDRDSDAGLVRRQLEDLASSFPHHAARLEALAARALPLLQPDSIALVPSHGDYHPNNVLITPRYTSVIDVDFFGLQEAAFDVGYAIGQLLIMSYFRTGDFAAGARAAGAFWRRYEPGGCARWPRVAVHIARTFVQSLHYELCVLLEDRENRVHLLDLWTDLSERWLESDGPAILEDLVRHR